MKFPHALVACSAVNLRLFVKSTKLRIIGPSALSGRGKTGASGVGANDEVRGAGYSPTYLAGSSLGGFVRRYGLRLADAQWPEPTVLADSFVPGRRALEYPVASDR